MNYGGSIEWTSVGVIYHVICVMQTWWQLYREPIYWGTAITWKYFLDGCGSLIQNKTVYIYDVDQWHYVCGDQITRQTTDVIRRENFNTSVIYYSSIPLSSVKYDFPIFGYTFNCTGNESSLCQCQNVTNSCSNLEILVVQVTSNTLGKDIIYV